MNRFIKNACVFAACMALCLAAIGMFGCDKQPTPTTSSSSAPSSAISSSSIPSSSSSAPASVAAPKKVGSGDTTVQVANDTGYDIVGVRIKGILDSEYLPEYTYDDFVFADGETIELSFDEMPDASLYDVLLVTSEDSKIAVRNIDLAYTDDIVFRFDKGIGFISYTDPVTGETTDNWVEALAAEEQQAQDPNATTYDIESQRG